VSIPPKNTQNEDSSGIALPVIVIIIVSAAVIGGAIWYSWKKR
jgi:hypothetical protein